MNFMLRPLLIITFQGVLGDFIKIPAFKLKEGFKVEVTRKTIRETKEEKELEMELLDTWKGLNLR